MKVQLRALLATIATIPAVAMAGAGVANAAPAAAEACPGTMIFEVGGHLDPDATVYNGFNGTLPAGVGATQIHYSASIAPYPGDPVSMDDSVAEGIGKLDRAVHDFHGACGGSHVTIVGYSEGALVAGDELLNLSGNGAVPHNQVNGVLYGDPRRFGANGSAGGIETNIPTIIPGLSMRGARGFGDIGVREICNQNDGICHSENPINNLLAFANGVAGYFMGDHGYDINPLRDNGNFDTLYPQPPRVNYGPPLPFGSPTLYDLFNGKLGSAQGAVSQVRDQVGNVLSPDLRAELARFPWLSVP